jgi:HD-GYP domain-containing protein (c-di-GMP phosphodiesterase class II)
MLVVVSFIALVYNLFDGAGLHDPATTGLLVWIILVALLFERIWILIGCLVAIGSLAAVLIAQELGISTPGYTATYFRLYTLSTVYILGSVSMYIFAGSWRRTIDSLQESYDRTLIGWVKALEYKDPATSGHVQEVVELTGRLAERMGCSSEEVQHIQRGALLHDIGKLGIPDRILAKSGPLSDDEWLMMREHPALAREFLSGIPFLAAAINIPYSHHERWNGEGYPQGLRGDEIPFAARIFAVVDVWHALGEDRPYRRAWTRPEIVEYLRSNSGTLFDPAVVRCFLELVA